MVTLDVETMRRELLARIGEGVVNFLSKLPANGANRCISVTRTNNPACPVRVRLMGADDKHIVTCGSDAADALAQAIQTYILSGERI